MVKKTLFGRAGENKREVRLDIPVNSGMSRPSKQVPGSRGAVMRTAFQAITVALAAACGVVIAMFFMNQTRQAEAASTDRYQDFILTTGAVSINPKVQTDGVWLLDYKSGKLLGTVIDRSQGKIVGWAEVDLTTEFNLPAKADVHFMMTTGYVTQGQ